MLSIRIAAFGALCALLGHGAEAFGQNQEPIDQRTTVPSGQSNPQKPPVLQQKMVVSAELTPEEVEDGKINEPYQKAYELQLKGNWAEAVEKYRDVVIPMAEQAKFKVPRNKFLFLAYRGMGDCDLSLRQYVDAEGMYQKTLEYATVWPGLNDSAYGINFRSMGIARMGQQNWKGAEEALLQADAIHAQQIERALHSDSEFERTGSVNLLRMLEDVTWNYLAVVYAAEGRTAEALGLLEKAYGQATKYETPPAVVKRIVESGLSISAARSESAAIAVWSERRKSIP